MKRVNLLWKKRTATRNEVINGRGCFWITSDPFSTNLFINKVFMLQTIRCWYHTHEFQMWPVIFLKWHSMIMFSVSCKGDLATWVSKWLSENRINFRFLDHSYTHIIKRIDQSTFFQSIMTRLNGVFVVAKVVECYLSIKFLWGWVNPHNGRFDILTNFSRAGSNISPQPLIIPGFLVSNFPRHSQVNIRSSLHI